MILAFAWGKTLPQRRTSSSEATPTSPNDRGRQCLDRLAIRCMHGYMIELPIEPEMPYPRHAPQGVRVQLGGQRLGVCATALAKLTVALSHHASMLSGENFPRF